MAKNLHLDFETRSPVDIKLAGADVYARDPMTDILCIAFAFDDEPISLLIPPFTGESTEKLFRHVAEGRTVIAHNAPFELAIWNHVMVGKHGAPPLAAEQMVCTMAMAYAMALPGSLDKASAAMGIDQQKDLQGQRIMLQLAQPRDLCDDGTPVWYTPETAPEKFERLYSYCKQDVEVERQLFKRMLPLSAAESETWAMDFRINQRGISVDIAAVKTAIAMVDAEHRRLDAEMRDVTGNQVAACTASNQILQWLKFRGCKIEGVAKADVNALLSKDIPDDCRRALLLRQEAAKSSTAKLKTMLKGVCEDGRLRGIFQYHGAATGRWAGRRVQPQNLPRPNMSQADIEGVFGILGRVESWT